MNFHVEEYVPMTRIRIADSGNGMGTTTSEIYNEFILTDAGMSLHRSCGITSGVLCEIVYLVTTVSYATI